MAVLGIDFGTTYTFVVKKDNEGGISAISSELYEAPIFDGTGDVLKYSNGIRTVIGYSDVYGWKIGQKAIELKNSLKDKNEFNIFYNLKKSLLNICMDLRETDENINNGTFLSDIKALEKLGNDKNRYGHEFKVDGKPKFFNAIELTKIFFNLLFNCNGECGKGKDPYTYCFRIRDINYNDIKCIVIGAPASDMDITNTSTNYSDKILPQILYDIRNILNLDGKIVDKDLMVVPEPQLAGMAFVADEGMPKLKYGEQLLIIDIGGGTSDFAVLENKDKANGTITAPFQALGNIEIAGKTFDEELEICLKEKYSVVRNDHFDCELLRRAKEELFLAKYSSKLEAIRSVNQWDDEETTYEKYLFSGRRSVISSNEQPTNYCCIVYNDRHKVGIKGDGYTDNCFDFEDPVRYDTKFIGICDALAKKLKAYITDNTSHRQKLNIKNLKVLFVGGSSQMAELRDTMCKKGLGLKFEDKQWKYTEYGCSHTVPVFFIGNNLKKKSELTYANMIAIGAAAMAEEQLSYGSNTINSVPDIWLGIPIYDNNGNLAKTEYYPLLSQNIKNGIFNNIKKCTIAGKDIEFEDREIGCLPWELEYDPDIDKKGVQFKLLREVQSPTSTQDLVRLGDNGRWYMQFPRNIGQYYEFHLQKDKLNEICNNGTFTVCFLADKPQGHGVAVFVCFSSKCELKNGTYYFDGKQVKTFRVVDMYDYRFPKKTDAGPNVKGSVEGIYGIRCYCKKYVFFDGNNNNKDRFKGCNYSISMNSGKDGYGWKCKGTDDN